MTNQDSHVPPYRMDDAVIYWWLFLWLILHDFSGLFDYNFIEEQ